MSAAHATIGSALGLGLLLTLGAPEKVAFQPEAGSSLTKRFIIAGKYALDEMSMTLLVDGQDVGSMVGQFDVTFQQERKIEVTDVYKAVAEGRPTELLRTFGELSEAKHTSISLNISPMQEEMQEVFTSSPLKGKTVAFRWDAERGEYELSFCECEAEEALLDDLEEDLDLRNFLPHSEVSPDESWTVELTSLECLVMPGGNPRMVPVNMPDADTATLELLEMFEETFGAIIGGQLGELHQGDCICTYKGTQEQNGALLGEIAIEIEVATTLDPKEMLDRVIRIAIEQQAKDSEFDITVDRSDLNLNFAGSAMLLWDLHAGRLHSFQLGGDATIRLELAVGVRAQGESYGVDASLEFHGELRQEIATWE